jgi:hypothetical protein
MTIPETILLAIAIGGFLLFLEGVITSIAERLRRRISEKDLKMIVGIVIWALAIVNLKIPSPWPYWAVVVVVAGLLLVLAGLIIFPRREKRRGRRGV